MTGVVNMAYDATKELEKGVCHDKLYRCWDWRIYRDGLQIFNRNDSVERRLCISNQKHVDLYPISLSYRPAGDINTQYILFFHEKYQ